MKKLLSTLLALMVLSAALCAAAAEPEAPAFTRVWGKVSPWEGEGIFLKNDDKEDHLNEVVVHLGDAPVVDAATGLPLDRESIQEGSVLYAWIGPAATMSLPPQVFAKAVVGNVPADAAVPEFCEIAGSAVVPAPGGDGSGRFPLTGGGTLEVTGKTAYTPWLTRQIVRMEDLTPGAGVLVWKAKDGTAEKVLLFPSAYRGYVSRQEDGTVLCGGEALSVKLSGSGLMPIRAVAEAAGYDVRWDKALGAVVSLNGETVFSVQPGAELLQTPDGEMGLTAPCLKEDGVTYLPAEDLCRCLNLFLTGAQS